MGCDIHMVVERRVRQENLPDRWVTVRTIRSITTDRKTQYDQRFGVPLAKERNYERFAALAGVRGDGPEARGLPDDASDTARLLFKLEGAHTPSWLPLAEATKIFLETESHNDLTEFEKKYAEYAYFQIETENDGELDDHRLVFWFDS